MVRRHPYTKVIKQNQVREEHVKGMGDVLYKVFQCLNSKCRTMILVKKDEISHPFEIICPTCGFLLKSGGITPFFDYKLQDTKAKKTLEKGTFSILHEDYVEEAKEYKYCIICNALKPVELFDDHASRKSGKQGECKLCKRRYNALKNPTRLADQHRESAQKRRLLLDLAGNIKIDTKKVFERFHYKCFKCGKDLSTCQSDRERPIDHTLPIFYLWPYTTDNATLLCQDHNGKKQGLWPSEFYTLPEIRRLSIITGLDYKLIAGSPIYNPEGLSHLQNSEFVDSLLSDKARKIDNIIGLRNRILHDTGLDFFEYSTILSVKYKKQADARLKETYGKRPKKNR